MNGLGSPIVRAAVHVCGQRCSCCVGPPLLPASADPSQTPTHPPTVLRRSRAQLRVWRGGGGASSGGGAQAPEEAAAHVPGHGGGAQVGLTAGLRHCCCSVDDIMRACDTHQKRAAGLGRAPRTTQ